MTITKCIVFILASNIYWLCCELTLHLCRLSVWALQTWKIKGLYESGVGVPWKGCFQSCIHDEGKLVVITEQMSLMRSLLDFQLALRALCWDDSVEVTGSFCDITSSPCCHSSCNHLIEHVPPGDGESHLFPLMELRCFLLC